MMLCMALSGELPARVQQTESMVKAELLADVSTIQPGQAFHVGVLFAIRPDWHIYWIYPGDAGVPTTVKLTAPAGFVVSQWQYPVPTRFEQAGDIVGNGYTDRVLLIAEIQAPRDLPVGDSVSFEATASWLACQDVCVPGRANLKLVLATAEIDKPINTELFGDWSKRLPIRPDGPESAAADLRIARSSAIRAEAASSQQSDDGFEITIRWKKPPREVQWFPQPPDGLAIEDIHVLTQGDQTRIGFQARLRAGQHLQNNVLPGVIAYRDTQGQLRGISEPIHLEGTTSQP